MFSQHIKHVFAVAILMVFAYSLPQVKSTLAATNAVTGACPANLVCVPIPKQPEGCPIGFSCAYRVIRSVQTVQGAPQTVTETKKDDLKYCYDFKSDISSSGLGDEASIFNLQTLLEDKEDIDIDNKERLVKNTPFGVSTLGAVKNFQKRYGIPQTGFVGPITRAKLNELYGCSNLNRAPKTLPLPTGFNQGEERVGPAIINTAKPTQYYSDTKISNVKILNKNTNEIVSEGAALVKGQTYTISWEASGVPETARFNIIFQSPTNPNIYGVLRSGLLGPSARSYDWTVESYMSESVAMKIVVQVGNERAYSPTIKIVSLATTATAPASVETLYAPKAIEATVIAPGIKNISPAYGIPGSKVTLLLSNPNKLSTKQSDFTFGNYALTNFTVTDNEVVTFTVPSDAVSGVYDVVWFGDKTYTVKYTVTKPTTKASEGLHFVASVFDSVMTIASYLI